MLNQKQYDLIIVGGGPAGTTCGYIAAQSGLSVLILEKDRDIGMPVRCGEAVSDTGLRIFHEPQKRWIKSEIDRIRLVAPNTTEIEFDLKAKGYILDRRIFDYDLAHFAAEQGAQIVTKAYVSSLLFDNNVVSGVKGTYLNEPFEIYGKLVVGADGVESRVGRWAGIKTVVKIKDMESAIQKTVSGIQVQSNMFDFYLSKNWAPGGYLWVFPKGDSSANIGLGISGKHAMNGKSAHKYLDEFLAWKYPNCSVLTTVVGGVPVAHTLKKIVADGVMLVGDAARTVNPMTGGGIISGMRSGLLAAETAVKLIKSKSALSAKNLAQYEKRWYKIGGKNHERYYRIKEAIFKFSDDNLNQLADQISSIPEDKRTLLKLFSEAVKQKPSLLVDVARLFAGI
ncbi:NAD(P)/FAD-dependent oxidoreductase [Candidatus Neomarinimicrobiota bacterium]